MRGGQRCKHYQASSSHLHQVHFTQDDNWVVTSGGDGVVMQWRLVRRAAGLYSRAPLMRWHPDGGVHQPQITRPQRTGGYTNPDSRRT